MGGTELTKSEKRRGDEAEMQKMMMGSLSSLFRIVVHVYFLFFLQEEASLLSLIVTGCLLRSISAVRRESYDGYREDTSAATGAPKEVVRDHFFSLLFLLAG